MKRLVIVGASGMVGGYALRYALEHPNVERVTSVGRRSLGISHSKLTEVLHRDFTDCSALGARDGGRVRSGNRGTRKSRFREP
jgi:N-acetyl-gamma-glutamylphosphate reductase